VGKAAVEMLLENDVVGNAARVGTRFGSALEELAERVPSAVGVRGVGMLYAFVLDGPAAQALHLACRRRGLLVRPGHDFIVIAPPLVTSESEADEIAAIIEAARGEVA
jgi:acetylornithine/succinyldiaminopimelate/putrescine aminotransferase